nr:MAG TPA: hypothetical protein [Caudoviricetes sp.]DAL06141.1 MAG TPA: hypothetical protein [Caudoviricetes sp.]DAN96516.1 MAG TPA: hypothetical protein [Caudoviricetes sp.]
MLLPLNQSQKNRNEAFLPLLLFQIPDITLLIIA